MQLALIHEGRVLAEIDAATAALKGPDDKPLFDTRDVSEVSGIAPGWLANNDGTFTAPSAAALSADQLIACANAHQRTLATGGYTAIIGGKSILFDTDPASLAVLDRKAMRLAQPNPPGSVNWQCGESTFVTIGADDFAHAATKIDDFVQATFDALPAVFAGIAAGTITTAAAVESAAWPAASGAVS